MNLHKNISNLSFQISTHTNALSAMEKDMVQTLMKSRSMFTYKTFTIAQIASVLNVSSTSLHRLSKKLGYGSFTLFKEDYFDNHKLVDEYEIKSDYLAMISTTYELVHQSLTATMINTMLKAKKITIYGMGMSSYLGKMFQIKLQLHGILAEQYDDSRFMRLSARTMKKDEDVIIILSRTGQPPELVEVMVEANQLGVHSILITESQGSPLQSMASFVVYTSLVNDRDDNVDTRINAHIAMDIIIKEFLNQVEKRKRDESTI